MKLGMASTIFIAFGLVFLFSATKVSAITYFVSKSGNNSTATTWSTAWNELNQINWNIVQPGDTVEIDGGNTSQTYYSQLSVGKSGTASNPITVKGSAMTGHNGQVVIDGQNIRNSGIQLTRNYVIVANMKVVNHNDDDVYVGGASYATLDGLEVLITGRAVFIENANHITVKNCHITTPPNLARQTDGIYSQKNSNNIYENNYIVIYNQNPDGHDDAIQMYLDDSMIVRGNYLAQDNSKVSNAQGLYATTMQGTSKFYNNVVNLGNAQSNALSFRRLPELGGTGTVEIIGNTVYGIRPYHGIWVTETDNPIVKNNLVYLLSGVALTLSGSSAGVSNNYTSGDPKFVNLSTYDFHLLSTSPAINQGTTLQSPYNLDKDGVTRPQGPAWDIGAYEYVSSVGVTPTPTPFAPPLENDYDADSDIDFLDLTYLITHFTNPFTLFDFNQFFK